MTTLAASHSSWTLQHEVTRAKSLICAQREVQVASSCKVHTVKGLIQVPFNRFYKKCKAKAFAALTQPLLRLVPHFSSFHSSSECRACVWDGRTHDSECVQPTITKRAVPDVLSHLACCQNTVFSFHTSLRPVSAALFSCIRGSAFTSVKSKEISWLDTFRR